ADAATNTSSGWYVSLAAGGNWIDDGNINEFESGALVTTNDFSWDTGFIATGAVGYDFGNHLRAEFELAYRDNDVGHVCGSSGFCDPLPGGGVWELAQMVNVFYDFDLGGPWSASLGAGVGGNLVVFGPGSTTFFDTTGSGHTASDYVLAGQLM